MIMFRNAYKSAMTVLGYFKKVLIVFIVFYSVITLFFYFMRNERPQSFDNTANEQEKIIYEKINDKELKKSPSGRISIAMYRIITCGLIGQGCTENQSEAKNYKNDSLFGRVTNWVAMPYSVPPASGLAWMQNGLQNSGLVPTAYAAEGIGFSSIKGYIEIWKVFRNIAFLLLVLIMLILGFLIMFRVRIDPQTIISIENALPRIVITMLLISFSFAIVGFLIDIMYLLIGVSVDLIYGYGLNFSPEEVAKYQNNFVAAKFNDLWPGTNAGWSFFGVGSSLWNMVPGEFKIILDAFVINYLSRFFVNLNLEKWENLIYAVNNIHAGAGAATFSFAIGIGELPGILQWLLSILLSGAISIFIPGIIFGLIIVLTILFSMFKIFFILLSSYIKIILYVIFSPIIILFEAVPGQNSFSWWIKNVIGELIVFPAVVVIMIVGSAILRMNWAFYKNPLAGSRFTGPSDNTFLLPFLYGFRTEDFSLIVGLGIILLIPDFIKIVKGWVGVQDMPLNLTLGTFLSGGSALVGGALGGATALTGWRSALVGQSYGVGALHSFQRVPGVGGLITLLQGKPDEKTTGIPNPPQTTK